MAAGQLFIIEVGIPNAAKVNVPIYFPDNAPNVLPNNKISLISV